MAKKNRNNSGTDEMADSIEESVAGEKKKRTDGGRRDALKVAVAAGIGVCALGTPICAGIRMVLAPINQEARDGKFYPLAKLDSLTEQPQKFFVIDEKRDAWMNTPDQKLGSLYLRKSGDQVSAFHSLCPHAGCMVQAGVKKNPQTGNDEEMFYCPCHAAHFDLDGKRLDTVAPRDLDSLEVKIEDETVYVKFQNFTFGITEKRNG